MKNINTNVISSAKDVHQKRVNIVNCLPENVFVEPGQSTPESAKAAMTALERAVEDIKEGYIDVLVTAPINKRAMVGEGFGYTGHTEYLEKEFGVEEVAMIMVCDRLKVGVVTGHIPLKEVPVQLTTEKILRKLRLMKSSLQRDFGIDAPKIAVLGLNPHCGDGGLLGDEEQHQQRRAHHHMVLRAVHVAERQAHHFTDDLNGIGGGFTQAQAEDAVHPPGVAVIADVMAVYTARFTMFYPMADGAFHQLVIF